MASVRSQLEEHGEETTRFISSKLREHGAEHTRLIQQSQSQLRVLFPPPQLPDDPVFPLLSSLAQEPQLLLAIKTSLLASCSSLAESFIIVILEFLPR